jgi:hypothetical protein
LGPYEATGSMASFSDHARVIGHGSGSSGAICYSSVEKISL